MAAKDDAAAKAAEDAKAAQNAQQQADNDAKAAADAKAAQDAEFAAAVQAEVARILGDQANNQGQESGVPQYISRDHTGKIL